MKPFKVTVWGKSKVIRIPKEFENDFQKGDLVIVEHAVIRRASNGK